MDYSFPAQTVYIQPPIVPFVFNRTLLKGKTAVNTYGKQVISISVTAKTLMYIGDEFVGGGYVGKSERLGKIQKAMDFVASLIQQFEDLYQGPLAVITREMSAFRDEEFIAEGWSRRTPSQVPGRRWATFGEALDDAKESANELIQWLAYLQISLVEMHGWAIKHLSSLLKLPTYGTVLSTVHPYAILLRLALCEKWSTPSVASRTALQGVRSTEDLTRLLGLS